jgi:hypothetical protein
MADRLTGKEGALCPLQPVSRHGEVDMKRIVFLLALVMLVGSAAVVHQALAE